MTRKEFTALYCACTAISITVSILAWSGVTLGAVSIPTGVAESIGVREVLTAVAVYGAGAWSVFELMRSRGIELPATLLFFGLQAGAVLGDFIADGSLYFPAAGSLGTLPSIGITATMLACLLRSERARARLD